MRLASRCVVTFTLIGSAACDQPAPKCNITRGAFAARYTLVSGDGPCAELVGEQLDVQSYYPPRSSTDRLPNLDKVSIAIQPMGITSAIEAAVSYADPAAGDVPYAIGDMVTASPDAAGFCVAPELSTARVRLGAIPEHSPDGCITIPAADARDLRYHFTNVRVYYTPSAIGTQFSADLTYTQDGCSAQYKVNAVYPMLPCAAPTDPPEDAPVPDVPEGCEVPEPMGPPEPDDSLCVSLDLNPDYAVQCDPATMMCVLAGDVPAFK